jgi:hypothetical protein
MSDEAPPPDAVPAKSVERLFPFVLKTRGLVMGREALRANKGKLHFVLIATDIAETGSEEVLKDFIHYPVVQHFTAAELQAFSTSRTPRPWASLSPASRNLFMPSSRPPESTGLLFHRSRP